MQQYRALPDQPTQPMSNDVAAPQGPESVIKTITAAALDELSGKAVAAERRRAHLNVHASLDANVQRLFIATEPDTYMRPHRHPEAHKWEYFMVLKGRIDLLVFSAAGELRQRIPLSPDTTVATEIPPGLFHAYVCMQPGTLAMEIKEGAYIPTPETDFASWAPAERSAGAAAYLQWMQTAQP